jgi:hypothetical protein
MRKAVLCAAFAFFAVFSAHAQYDPPADFAAELSSDGTSVKITGYLGAKRIVRIPARIQNLPVTCIGQEAFVGDRLTGVTIPNSVTRIEWSAFADNDLTSIVIPASVTSIGEGAFALNKLTRITLPRNTVEIAQWAFIQNKLTSVNVPRSAVVSGQAFDDGVKVVRR